METKSKFKIGCHLSSSGGFLAMGKTAVEIGANTFQFFTRNPRGGAAKPVDPKDTEAFKTYSKENGIEIILAHAPYTLNCASADPRISEFALSTMTDDMKRMALVPGNMYNFHPGCHVGIGTDEGIKNIVSVLDKVMEVPSDTKILLETMAGKGSEIGGRFEEIRQIIDLANKGEKLGVCLDTCHVNDAGYDIVNDLDGVLEQFDKVIGFDRLCAIHINDSMNPLGSHKDRHQKIGEGSIGIEAFERIINHPSLKDLPFYLETPNELDGYQKEIALLRSLRVKTKR